MDPDHLDEDREAACVFMRMQPLLFDGTRRTVSLAAWLHDMEQIFRTCHIEARLQVMLATRCLALDARFWWMTVGEREMPSQTWADFRTLIVARYGPILDEAVGEPERDPHIYRDMYHTRYQSYAAVWRAYPHESMSHYCRRFQEAMMPQVPQDLGSPVMHALQTLRDGLPAHIRVYVPTPLAETTIEQMVGDILEAEMVAHIIQADVFPDVPPAPADDAGLGEHFYEAGPLFPEEPIPAVPLQEIPPEAEADGDEGDFNPDDLMDIPEDPLEDLPLYDIPVEEGEEEDPEEDPEEEPEPEPEHAGWLDEDEGHIPMDDQEGWDDVEPEEVPLDEADSDQFSDLTDEDLD